MPSDVSETALETCDHCGSHVGLQAALGKEPGLTVKDLAERLNVNRQFMAGFLAALEELGEVSYRKVGPARIYFTQAKEAVAEKGPAANSKGETENVHAS